MSSDSPDTGEQWAAGNYSVVPEQVAADFDAEAADYDENLRQWGYRVPIDGVAMLADVVPTSASILDAGCGTGMIGSAIRAKGYRRMTGCDISGGMLDVARSKYVYERLDIADLSESLPYGDDEFDAVVCLATLSFIEDAETTFREFCRVTAPGGVTLFSHRCDLYRNRRCADLCARLERNGVWQLKQESTANPYLPDHPAYRDRLTVSYYVYRVPVVDDVQDSVVQQ